MRPEMTPGWSITLLTQALCLIDEEYKELQFASSSLEPDLYNKRARENFLKELTDLIYVCFQMAVNLNLPITEAYLRVHASNMSKLDDNGNPIFKDGKVMKGPNYKPPSLIDIV